MRRFKYIVSFAIIATLGVAAFIMLPYIKSQTPDISVVMPVYNREKLVGRAIESILDQTYQNFEFIIVDDGSTDHTKKVIEVYAKKDKRIKFFQNDSNKGTAYGRNRAISLAKGKYIAIMDSDDYAEKRRLEKSISFMHDHPEIDALSGGILRINNTPEEKLSDKNLFYQPGNIDGEIEVGLMFSNIFPNPAAFFKRSLYTEKGIKYNPAVASAEDYDFWKSCIFAGAKFAKLKDRLTYIGHASNKPNKYYENMYDNSIEIHRQFFFLFFPPGKRRVKI